jgi:biotin operon repressor
MPEQKQQQNMSKEEQIGFHKGSLATLAKEREEMAKILNIVEQLMQAHIKALKDLGIDLEAQAKDIAEKQKLEPKGTDKKIDELI